MNPFAQLRARLQNYSPLPPGMPLPGVDGDAAYLLTVLEQLLPADDFTGDPAKYCLDKMTAFGSCEAVNVLWQRFVR
jgi:hypothetical protein